MFIELSPWLRLVLAIIVAFAISIAVTPAVKSFASKVGAVDVPDHKRHIHDHPIPRMGGLAIFFGFLVSVLLFAEITTEVRGILIGTIVIVITGALDDVLDLKPWVKLLAQIAAAVIAVAHGVVIRVFMNPNVFSETESILLGWIGGKMIYEGLRPGEDAAQEKRALGLGDLLVQAVATSIDALSAGFTLAEYAWFEAFLASVIIAVVTFILCVFGVLIGRKAGTGLAGKASIVGGIILVVIGLRIFIGSFL